MGITIKCGRSIETIQNVLEEIERKMPNVSWATGTSPASWCPKAGDNENHVALFVSDDVLTFAEDLKEYVEDFISLHHRNDTVIYAEDFISEGTPEDIQNETDISFLFN